MCVRHCLSSPSHGPNGRPDRRCRIAQATHAERRCDTGALRNTTTCLCLCVYVCWMSRICCVCARRDAVPLTALQSTWPSSLQAFLHKAHALSLPSVRRTSLIYAVVLAHFELSGLRVSYVLICVVCCLCLCLSCVCVLYVCVLCVCVRVCDGTHRIWLTIRNGTKDKKIHEVRTSLPGIIRTTGVRCTCSTDRLGRYRAWRH